MKYYLIAFSVYCVFGFNTANAEYFFTANDVAISKCLHTSMSGKEKIKTTLEKSYGVKCSAIEDNKGTIIITCKAGYTNMIFVAKSESTCNSLRKNVRTILK